jgi:S1-C subfamily serine protease
MTQLDWLIVGFGALFALLGFRQGFMLGVLSFGGFALGAFLGTRIGPVLLPHGSSSPYAPAFGLVGALFGGAILASGLEILGLRLRRVLVIPGFSFIDGVLGALLCAVIGLGIVWIAAAVVAQVPAVSSLRVEIQRSVILGELNKLLPPTGPILNALARLDPLPQIAGPSPDVAPPLPALAHTPEIRSASASVVRVVGSACGLAVEGSGWVARPGVVVTNAHVIAGEHDTSVEVAGHSPELSAQPIAFDPSNDVAVLRVTGLKLPALSLVSNPPSGSAGAILGYPENGPLDAQPGRIGQTQKVLTQDAYGRGPILRLLTPLRGLVRPGNSGGPLLDRHGDVLTTVFAGTTNSVPRGGYGVANSIVQSVLAGSGKPVATGSCVEAG